MGAEKEKTGGERIVEEKDEKGRISIRRIYRSGTLVSQTSYLPLVEGHPFHAFESVPDEKGTLVLRRKYDLYPDGSTLLVQDLKEHTIDYFAKNGKKIMHEINPNDLKKRDIVMLDEKGEILIRTYQAEKKLHPDLTEKQYIDDILVKNLTTPERLHFFCDHFIQYLPDSEDRFRGNPDYWQTPEETVETMTGDCEDVAFLTEYILKLQGKNPHVVALPHHPIPKGHLHAACIWIEKRSDGRFDVCSLCNFGLDVNGNPFAHKTKPEREKGYTREEILKGLNALAEKYPATLVGLPEGKTYSFDPKKIRIMHAPNPKRAGKSPWEFVSIDVFFKKSEAR